MDEDVDIDIDEELEEPEQKKPKPVISSKKPKKAPPAPGGKKITIYFQSTIGPGEKKQKLTVNPSNDVGSIKQTVGNLFGLDPEEFHLSYGGVTMDDNSPFSEYNVEEGDTVLLIPASTAG